MKAPESILETLKKIKALADRGRPGEADVARRKLDLLLKKHDMTISDLQEEAKLVFEFAVSSAEDEKLLVQICAKVTQSRTFSFYGVRIEGRKMKRRAVELTKAQHLDVSEMYSYYRRAFRAERKRLLEAFIQRHQLTPPRDETTKNSMTPEEMEALFAMMMGLREESFPERRLALPDQTERKAS